METLLQSLWNSPPNKWENLPLPGNLPWWLRWQRICLQCRRPGFGPWVSKIPWRRKWQPPPVFLPGKSNGHRSLVSYSPWDCKGDQHDLATKQPQSLCISHYAKWSVLFKPCHSPMSHYLYLFYRGVHRAVIRAHQIRSDQSLSRVRLFATP